MSKIMIKVPEELAQRRTLNDMKRLAGIMFGDDDQSFVRLNVVHVYI